MINYYYMFYFTFALLYFVLFGILNSLIRDNRKFYLLLYIAIVGFWGLSYTYAADVEGYMEYFYREVKTISQGIDLSAHGFEAGFNLLAAICKSIVPEYIFFQFTLFAIEMALVIIGITSLLTTQQARCVLVLLFFLYPSMLAATRQGMSIALIIYALQFIKDKSWKCYFGLIAIAYTFHHSSLIAIPLYFVIFFKKYLEPNTVLISILLLADLCWFLGISLSNYLASSLAVLLNNGSEIEKYSIYMNDAETSVSNYGLGKILEINIAYIGYLYYRKLCNDSNVILPLFLILYTIIGLMLGGILAHRFLYYFIIVYYACVVIGINSLLSKSSSKTILGASYAFLALYMFWFYIIRGDMMTLEYIFLP